MQWIAPATQLCALNGNLLYQAVIIRDKTGRKCSGVGLVWSDDKSSRAVVLQVRWHSQTASVNESLRPLEPLSEEEAFIQKYLKLADTALKSKPTRNAA